MAREILFMHAIGEAMASEMERDPTVLLIGEDVAGGCGAPGGPDSVGGIMGVTKGLYTKYPGRMIVTPFSESALVGAGVGAAVPGMRPIVELMFVDFLGVCFDQIFNQAAKMRYMFGGKAKVPLVVRTLCGGKASASAQHSQMLTPIFTHIRERARAAGARGRQHPGSRAALPGRHCCGPHRSAAPSECRCDSPGRW